jgi:hypothetical protein
MELSGCRALEGCDLKNKCYRYTLFLKSTPYKGFNAHQTCRLSHFTEKKYLHFIETPGILEETGGHCAKG